MKHEIFRETRNVKKGLSTFDCSSETGLDMKMVEIKFYLKTGNEIKVVCGKGPPLL